MFRGNTVGLWTKRDGYNIYGEPTWRGPFKVPCASLGVAPTLSRTPIRSDASASQAASDEVDLINSRILIPAGYPVRVGDKFELDGLVMRISSVQSNNNVLTGETDHYEIGLEAWQIDGS